MSFPKVLDAYEFCSDELKQVLDQGREYEKKLRDEETDMMIDSQSKEEVKRVDPNDKEIKVSDE